jgi:hypothetical protein
MSLLRQSCNAYAIIIRSIESPRSDAYRDKVVRTYDDSPEIWQKALREELRFNFGLFDQTELNGGAKPGSVGPFELRYFERQLELAGLLMQNRPQLRRIELFSRIIIVFSATFG